MAVEAAQQQLCHNLSDLGDLIDQVPVVDDDHKAPVDRVGLADDQRGGGREGRPTVMALE